MTRRAGCKLGAALLLSLVSRDALAYRPFDGTDADVAGYHEFELEIGPLGYLAEPGRRTLVAPALVINYGIIPRWELVLEGSHAILLGDTHGEERFNLADSELSAKTLLRSGSLQDGGSGLSVASELSAVLPTTEEQGVGAGIRGIVSQRFSALTVHFNAAGELTRTHYVAPWAGVILEGPHGWLVRPVGEAFAVRELRSHVFRRGTTLSGLVGAVCAARDELSFDVAARVALQDGTDRVYELRAGFTWAFEP